MCKMMYKLQLFFEFFEIRKSKHSLSYVSLFMMRKNRKEQNLVRQFARDGTLANRKKPKILDPVSSIKYPASSSPININQKR